MRGVFALVLLIGMGLAGFAVYMVNQQIEQTNSQLAQAQAQRDDAVQTVDVYTVNKAFTYGEVLTADDVVLMKYARDTLPEGIVQAEEVLFPPEQPARSRVVILPIIPNEPLTQSRLAVPGATRGLTALVAPGMRAFPIQGRVTGGFGTLRPDDRIDLYWSGRLQSGRSVTQLLKSGLEIIAVPDDELSSGINNVIVQVTPQEVAVLTQAQSSGSLTISLVGSGDNVTVDTDILADDLSVTGEVIEEVVEEVKEAEEEICYRFVLRGTERVQTDTIIPCD
jgi:pilus assembly protein CpaB